MASNFKTLTEANAEVTRRNKNITDHQSNIQVWNLESHINVAKRKMKRPFFVGTYLEYLNR